MQLSAGDGIYRIDNDVTMYCFCVRVRGNHAFVFREQEFSHFLCIALCLLWTYIVLPGTR